MSSRACAMCPRGLYGMHAAQPGARERLVRQARQISAARWPTAGVLTLPTHLHRAGRALVLVLVLPVQEGLDFLERDKDDERQPCAHQQPGKAVQECDAAQDPHGAHGARAASRHGGRV